MELHDFLERVEKETGLVCLVCRPWAPSGFKPFIFNTVLIMFLFCTIWTSFAFTFWKAISCHKGGNVSDVAVAHLRHGDNPRLRAYSHLSLLVRTKPNSRSMTLLERWSRFASSRELGFGWCVNATSESQWVCTWMPFGIMIAMNDQHFLSDQIRMFWSMCLHSIFFIRNLMIRPLLWLFLSMYM